MVRRRYKDEKNQHSSYCCGALTGTQHVLQEYSREKPFVEKMSTDTSSQSPTLGLLVEGLY